MTVIAWDGKTLAADKQATVAGQAYTTTKIHRVPGGLVAFSGCGTHAAELLEWFKKGRIAKDYPSRTNFDEAAGSTYISNEGIVYMYAYNSGYPEVFEDSFYARGAGRDYALAAMFLGESAARAVEVACAFDTSCGRGVDTLTLEG
jgi:ATP-dependent protease HslVU (ClpYQ) peptidase subunit